MLAIDMLMADFDKEIEQRRTCRSRIEQVIERLEEHSQTLLRRKRQRHEERMYVRVVEEFSCK